MFVVATKVLPFKILIYVDHARPIKSSFQVYMDSYMNLLPLNSKRKCSFGNIDEKDIAVELIRTMMAHVRQQLLMTY